MPPAGLGQASVDLVRLVRFASFFFSGKILKFSASPCKHEDWVAPAGLGASDHRFG